VAGRAEAAMTVPVALMNSRLNMVFSGSMICFSFPGG
jgi:hypothetical protein